MIITNVCFVGLAKDLIDSAIEGFNSTIFAYGQTSSGKTHTMRNGAEEFDGAETFPDAGIIPQAIEQIFAHIEDDSQSRQFLVRLAFMEIYNECVYDLLGENRNRALKVEEDTRGNNVVNDLTGLNIQ